VKKSIAVVALVGVTAAFFVYLKSTESHLPQGAASDFPDLSNIRSTQISQQAQLDSLAQSIASLQETVLNLREDTHVNALPASSSLPIVGRNTQRWDERALRESGLNELEAQKVNNLVSEINSKYLGRHDDDGATARSILNEVRDAITTQVGGHGYDSYLYASGQRNRLEIRGVYTDSVAQEVGIQAGDRIYSLDGRRVHSQHDLVYVQAEKSSADPTELIEIRLMREGAVLDFYIPRGHLGLRVSNKLVNPVEDASWLAGER
jgi:hypothetical protein